MPPANKWTSGESPDQPLEAAARMALEARLTAVEQYLTQAATLPATDIENIHQLRVWSRRAAAALQAFSTVLPRRRRKWLERKLQRLRRAAGTARDCDVLLAQLAAQPKRAIDDSSTAVIEHVTDLRSAAQRPIDSLYRRLARRFSKRVGCLLERVQWRGQGPLLTFGAAAREQLTPAITAFFAAADGDLSDVMALHRFRIAGKRLRYGMELFAAAFSPAFREELYPIVESLQEKLGKINDHATWVARFQSWQSELPPPAAKAAVRLLRAEKRALSRARQDFVAWWSPDRAADLQRRFARVLAQQSGSLAV